MTLIIIAVVIVTYVWWLCSSARSFFSRKSDSEVEEFSAWLDGVNPKDFKDHRSDA